MTRTRKMLISAGLLVAAAAPVAAQEGEIQLRVGGGAGTAFTADCELKTAGGTETFSLQETAPFEASYVGSGLSCRVSASQMIDVEVAKGGSSSRSRVSGGTVRVNVGS